LDYPHGDKGVVGDPVDANVARQHPQDYLDGLKCTGDNCAGRSGYCPVRHQRDRGGCHRQHAGSRWMRLGCRSRFFQCLEKNSDAYAWLWKDHTSHAEALEITDAAKSSHPEYLAACGGAYSSEWYWAKLLHCSRVAPDVFEAAASWTELPDWIPAVLTGTQAPEQVKRCSCAAGHKGMFSPEWGGYPAEDFIASFDNGVLSKVRKTLKDEAF